MESATQYGAVCDCGWSVVGPFGWARAEAVEHFGTGVHAAGVERLASIGRTVRPVAMFVQAAAS